MKKILFTLIACLTFSLAGFAKSDTTGKAATFTTQIKNYLTAEGYQPSLDDDGEIKFKSQGKTFYISVKNYDDGVCVDIYNTLGIADSNLSKVRIAADNAQMAYKWVRVDIDSSEMCSFNVWHYFDSMVQFKAMFPNFISVIRSVRDKMVDEYND